MPYKTDELIYVHLPKCGGTWVGWYLQNECRFAQIQKGHDPLSCVPLEEREGRLVVGSLRDPWSWYRSWYLHARKRVGWTEALKVYGDGTTTYPEVIYGVTHPTRERCPEAPSVLVDYQHEREAFLASGRGLYSWYARYMFGWPYEVKAIIDLKSLTPGLEQVLKRKVDRDVHPPRNITARNPPLTRYEKSREEELNQWIWEADREIIDLMGYTDMGVPAKFTVKWL